MPSTYTVNLGIEKPATGEQSGTWGDTTNVNFDILDQAINGAERVTLTSAGSSGSPNSLQITNGATSDGRNKWLEFYSSSDLGGSAYVQLDPNDAEKIVFVRNSLAGSQSVILFQGTYNAARDLEVPAGVDMVVKFDGGGASAATVTDVFTKLRATEITTPTLTATTADINGGTIDNSVIGGSTAAAVTGTTVVANTSLNIAGDGATVTGIKDEDDMSSNSPTKLATQQSIKAYVDSQVGTVDTWAEVLANGATSGSTNPEVTAGQALKTNTINETSAGSGVTIDSVLLKDDVVNATDIETGSISANDGTASATIANSTGVMTIASSVLTTADINAGTIDNSTIGGSTPAVGTFTQVNVDNITIDGSTLASSGSLSLDIGGNLTIDVAGTTITLADDGANWGQMFNSAQNFYFKNPTSDKDILFQGIDGGVAFTALTLDMSDAGAATFNSGATFGSHTRVNGDFSVSAASGEDRLAILPQSAGSGTIVFSGNAALSAYEPLVIDFETLALRTSGTPRLSIASDGAATFTGAITANAGITVDTINIDGATIATTTGNFFIDGASDIYLDADGGNVFLRDDGTNFGNFNKNGNNLKISSSIQDGDIVFAGNDGGSAITALTLDMSAAGAATFNSSIIMSGVGSLTEVNENFCISGTDADHAGLIMATHAILPAEVGAEAAANVIDIGANGNEFKSLYLDTSIIASNALSINAGTILTLDAGSGVIDFDDNGTNIGRIENSSSDFKLESRVQDKDIVFVGNDGGSGVTALTLDMSAAGAATFNSTISSGALTTSGNITLDMADGGGAPAMTATLRLKGYQGRGAGIKIQDSVNSATGASDREWFIGSGYNQSGFNIGYAADGSQSSYPANNKLSIDTDGVVDVGPTGGQTFAILNARRNGAAIEFGHGNNSSGYYGTAGSYGNNGQPYIGFSCWSQENLNLFTTNGFKGNLLTGDLSGNLTFAQITNANAVDQSPTNRMTLDSDGHLIVGAGITLGNSLSYAAANTLDDYEEGTWSPAIRGDGSWAAGTQTYTIRTGNYVKVGAFVYLAFDVQLNALGTVAGNYLQIGNFPFTVASSNLGGGNVSYYSNLSNTSGPLLLYAASTQGYLMEGATTYVSLSDATNSTRLIGTIMYKTSQ